MASSFSLSSSATSLVPRNASSGTKPSPWAARCLNSASRASRRLAGIVLAAAASVDGDDAERTRRVVAAAYG